MLSSQDLKIIVGALQMSDLLMQKLPHIFAIYFRREGVMHQIKRLCDADAFLAAPRSKSASPSAHEAALGFPAVLSEGSPLLDAPAPAPEEEKLSSPPQLRFTDVLKRKRPKPTGRLNASSGWRRGGRQEDTGASPTFSELLIKSESRSCPCGSRCASGSIGVPATKESIEMFQPF